MPVTFDLAPVKRRAKEKGRIRREERTRVKAREANHKKVRA